MKLVARAYHINQPFGSPATKEVRQDMPLDVVQSIAGEAVVEIMHTIRIRGFTFAGDFNIRLHIEE